MLDGSTCGGAVRWVFFVKWGQWGIQTPCKMCLYLLSHARKIYVIANKQKYPQAKKLYLIYTHKECLTMVKEF